MTNIRYANATNQFRYYYFMVHGISVRQISQKIVSTHPNTANQFSLRVLGTYKVKVNIENKKKTDKQTWKRKHLQDRTTYQRSVCDKKTLMGTPPGKVISPPLLCSTPQSGFPDGGRLSIIIIGGRFPNAFSEKFVSMNHNC